MLAHQGTWAPRDAMAWCVWAAFATLAALEIIRPLKMLPILCIGDFLQSAVAHCGVPAMVTGCPGWFVGGEHCIRVHVGNIALQFRTLELCVRQLHLQAEG
jgi:hypothetical protein